MQEIPVTPTPTTTIPLVTAAVLSGGVREFFVPFGSGSGSAKEWSDIEGIVCDNQYCQLCTYENRDV